MGRTSAAAAAAAAATAAATEPGDATLLIIDDSELLVRALRARLRGERLGIFAAATADEGIEAARRLEPEVILLDLDVPGLDGYALLHELKGDPRTSGAAVILISSRATTPRTVRGFEMGAVDFIAKPFEIAELKARVRSALRTRRLIEMLAQRAQVDGVTGLLNRAYFDDRLEQEVAIARRHRAALALILCDVDHFKRLNDDHGHPFGDRVLEELGELLCRGRAGDIACRYGGEEFAIILPRTDVEQAAEVAERLRRRLAEITWPGHPRLRVTASFGVADLHRAGEASADALLHAADRALYRAKREGRNRVRLVPRRRVTTPAVTSSMAMRTAA